MTEDTVKPEPLSIPYFIYKTFAADTDHPNEERVFALRYQVYCLERCFLPAENYPGESEQDEYDAFSTHIAAYSLTDILVGSLRLVTPPNGGGFPFQEHCTQLFADRTHPANHECAEISRLVISKLYRRRAGDSVFGVPAQLMEDPPVSQAAQDRRREQRSDSDRRKLQPAILLGLFRQAYRHCKQQGIGYLYMALEKSLVRLLQRMFFFSLETIGEPVDYYGPVIPCILPMENFDHALSRGDPILFAWFQDALKE